MADNAYTSNASEGIPTTEQGAFAKTSACITRCNVHGSGGLVTVLGTIVLHD